MTAKIKISIITSVYRGITYLEAFFENFLEITNMETTELIIVHNDPTREEMEIVNAFSKQIPHFVYVKVSREPLYTSWNRAIQHSKGKYLAMWSVDDRRTPDSLRLQAKVLDENPDCMIVSGNYYKVFRYGDTRGFLKKDPVKKSWFNKVPKFNNGCFLMWRKTVHDKIGYFDEQFKVGGDWEFWARVTYNHKALSSEALLGYFLRINNEGLSKRNQKGINTENQIVNLRFYNLFLINVYPAIFYNNIALTKIKNFGELKPIKYNRFSYTFAVLPSFLFFWVNGFRKKLLRMVYKRRERLTAK